MKEPQKIVRIRKNQYCANGKVIRKRHAVTNIQDRNTLSVFQTNSPHNLMIFIVFIYTHIAEVPALYVYEKYHVFFLNSKKKTSWDRNF